MTKLMTVLAAAAFALTALFASGADAAFNVRLSAPGGLSMLQKAGCHGGGGGYFRPRHRYHFVRRSIKPKVHVARVHSTKPVTVAKVEEPKVEDTAAPQDETAVTEPTETENSTVTPTADAATDTTDTAVEKADAADVKTPAPAKPEKKVAAKDLGCKAFFPAIGMTLSVPCT